MQLLTDILDIDISRRQKIAIAIPLVLIVAGGMYYHFQLSDHFETYQTGPVERATLKANYSVENESLTIAVTEGNFTSKSTFIALKKGPGYSPSNSPENDFVLKKGDETRKTHIWASNALHHIPWRMEDLPLTEGSQITVVADGDDSDNDGQKGIENGEKVLVTSYHDGYYGAVNTFVIHNNTAVCTLIGETKEFLTGEISCYE